MNAKYMQTSLRDARQGAILTAQFLMSINIAGWNIWKQEALISIIKEIWFYLVKNMWDTILLTAGHKTLPAAKWRGVSFSLRSAMYCLWGDIMYNDPLRVKPASNLSKVLCGWRQYGTASGVVRAWVFGKLKANKSKKGDEAQCINKKNYCTY